MFVVVVCVVVVAVVMKMLVFGIWKWEKFTVSLQSVSPHWFVRSQRPLQGRRTCLAVSLGLPVTDTGSALDLVQEGGAEDAEVAGAYVYILGHSM